MRDDATAAWDREVEDDDERDPHVCYYCQQVFFPVDPNADYCSPECRIDAINEGIEEEDLESAW